jgi:plasmid stabilization system protein ParE
VRLTRRALADAKRMKTWWWEHRPAAVEVFEHELEATLARIAASPNMGSVFEPNDVDAEVRRVLMPRTRNHVYYAVTATEIMVLTVWGAPKGRGPRL